MSNNGFNPVQIPFAVRPLRPEAAIELVRALEALLPPAELAWLVELTGATREEDAVRFIRVPDRDAYLREQFARGETAHLSSALGQPPVKVHFLTFARRPPTARDGTQRDMAYVWLPREVLSDNRLDGLMEAAGDALGALHGAFMPSASSVVLSELRDPNPRGTFRRAAAVLQAVPALAMVPRLDPNARTWVSALAPGHIGWLNYWSSETARFVGMEEPPPGVRRTAAGAWFWRLTPEPFDVRRPDHVAALVDAYRRFPGVRSHV